MSENLLPMADKENIPNRMDMYAPDSVSKNMPRNAGRSRHSILVLQRPQVDGFVVHRLTDHSESDPPGVLTERPKQDKPQPAPGKQVSGAPRPPLAVGLSTRLASKQPLGSAFSLATSLGTSTASVSLANPILVNGRALPRTSPDFISKPITEPVIKSRMPSSSSRKVSAPSPIEPAKKFKIPGDDRSKLSSSSSLADLGCRRVLGETVKSVSESAILPCMNCSKLQQRVIWLEKAFETEKQQKEMMKEFYESEASCTNQANKDLELQVHQLRIEVDDFRTRVCLLQDSNAKMSMSIQAKDLENMELLRTVEQLRSCVTDDSTLDRPPPFQLAHLALSVMELDRDSCSLLADLRTLQNQLISSERRMEEISEVHRLSSGLALQLSDRLQSVLQKIDELGIGKSNSCGRSRKSIVQSFVDIQSMMHGDTIGSHDEQSCDTLRRRLTNCLSSVGRIEKAVRHVLPYKDLLGLAALQKNSTGDGEESNERTL